MKLIPKEPDTSVNVSNVSEVTRLFQILGGLLVVSIGVYVILGLLVNIAAPYIPETLEHKMGEAIISEWPVVEYEDHIKLYQGLLSELIGQEAADEYSIRIVDSPEVNAVAIPGNVIVVFSGLAEEITDEEVLSFVLGHELGHFKNRDHIKSYGRVLVLSLLVNIISGQESTLTDLTVGILSKTEMKFSQKDELNADAYGVDLINNAYGSSEGAIEFFEIMDEIQGRGKLESYFDSHPHPEKRIEAILELRIDN